MGNAPSMLTQYDIEEVQQHSDYLFSQQEIVALYERFCQLDRNAKGFISAEEFLSIPEFSLNPLSQRLLRMVDGLNFKDFVAFLSSFSPKASLEQKIELIFKVYDVEGKGRVTFKDLLEVLRDLTGSFMSDEQREHVLNKVLVEAGFSRDASLLFEDFVKEACLLHTQQANFLQGLMEMRGPCAGPMKDLPGTPPINSTIIGDTLDESTMIAKVGRTFVYLFTGMIQLSMRESRVSSLGSWVKIM